MFKALIFLFGIFVGMTIANCWRDWVDIAKCKFSNTATAAFEKSKEVTQDVIDNACDLYDEKVNAKPKPEKNDKLEKDIEISKKIAEKYNISLTDALLIKNELEKDN